MSRYRTVSDEVNATMPMVRSESQRRPTGRSTTRGDNVPVITAAMRAPAVVTPHAGNDEIKPAIGNAKRGHGVKRTRMLLLSIDAVPIVIEAWKNDQALSPTSAKTEYGIPGCTFARFRKAMKKPASNAKGWKNSQIGPRTDCLYLTLKSRAAITRMTWPPRKMSASLSR